MTGRLNVLGTRLRPIDDLARGLIAEALNAGQQAVAHLMITDESLHALAVIVCQAIAAQVVRGAWAQHDVHTVSDMGIIRALPYLQRDEMTGAIVGVRVEVWLAAFVERTDGVEVSVQVDAALEGCKIAIEDESLN